MGMAKILLVLIGGALGTGCRYAFSSFVYSLVDEMVKEGSVTLEKIRVIQYRHNKTGRNS
jgi:hypothetical protein